ncbi:SRPBCC family protein [Pelagibius sp. CAU 1746]|uniref:SRPBCC family protein n=1 Tax=Pelagibius sp. CAU 1746 TaxID=3140370 RepID=UPI00325ACC06
MEEFGTATAVDTLRIERLLPGPIERVWSYLTESEKRKLWLAAGEADLRSGGKIVHVFRNSDLCEDGDLPPEKYAGLNQEFVLNCTVTACDPPRLLSYLWGDAEDASEVRFELTEEGEKVRLVVTHRRLRDRDIMLSVSAGWHAHLGILIDLLEGRRPQSFWSTQSRLEKEYDRRLPGR